MSPAAASVIERLELLPTTRNRPVDTEGLGRVIRSADALHGSVLLQVLLHLKEQRRWEMAVALATLVEASYVEAESPLWEAVPQAEREVSEIDEDDDEAADEAFRRMVASSPNYRGGVEDSSAGGIAATVVAEDWSEAGDEEGATAADTEEASEHPMAALLGLDAADADANADANADAADAAPGDGLPQPTPLMTPLSRAADAPPVETTHYNVVIATCAAARRWQEALELLTRMRQRGVPRDTFTYNSVLSALGRGGRWKLAMKVFNEMQSEQVPPTTVTFASAIAACGRAGEWQRALSLLDIASQTGTPRNTIVYSSAITACEKAGEWQAALELLERMEGDGVEADATALNAAMSACARAAQPEPAERLLRAAFAKHGVEPDSYSYNALLSALARSQPEAAEAQQRAVARRKWDVRSVPSMCSRRNRRRRDQLALHLAVWCDAHRRSRRSFQRRRCDQQPPLARSFSSFFRCWFWQTDR